jgi:hypothetical protein
MNTLPLAEERRAGLKNNTTCVSPAPIKHFTIASVKSVLAGIVLAGYRTVLVN